MIKKINPRTPIETNVIELLILMTCIMAPFFILANEVSGDEMLKSSAGIFLAAAAATVITAYKVWKGSND